MPGIRCLQWQTVHIGQTSASADQVEFHWVHTRVFSCLCTGQVLWKLKWSSTCLQRYGRDAVLQMVTVPHMHIVLHLRLSPMALSRWQWHSHQHENHNNITARIKEIISSPQLLLGNSPGLSASAGNGKLYIWTQIRTLICTRLQMKSIQNIATDKYRSSSETQRTQRDANLMWSSLAGSFPWQVGQSKTHFCDNKPLYHLLWPTLCNFSYSHKKTKLHQRETLWSFHKQNIGNQERTI